MSAAVAHRDRETILEVFHPQIEWVQNEGVPGGGRHVGAEAVRNDVFAKFRAEGSDRRAVVEDRLDAGDTIIALGQYRGTFRATGRSTTAAFAHVYRLGSGRVVRFQRYADTLKVADAMPPTE